MKQLNIFTYAFLIIISGCTSQKNKSKTSLQDVVSKLPFPTEEIYFQKWIGGQERTGGGTNFYIKFKKTFPANILLKKVYFREKEAAFKKRDTSIYYAYFYDKPTNPDLILEEDTASKELNIKNQGIKKVKYNLKENEAILEFEKNSKLQYFKISNITEKELLAYPSAKPRN